MAKQKGKKKNNRAALIVLLCILALILLMLVAAFFMYKRFYDKTHYETEPSEIEIVTEPEVVESIETVPESEEESLIEDISKEQSEAAEETVAEEEKHDVLNILLVGVDRRARDWNGNSDAMILCTINYDKKKVVLTSLMRDTCANIPGVGIRKLNAAFALGGAPLLMSTLEQNFTLEIDNYAWLDFEDMKQVIDILGGVDIQLTVKEAERLKIAIASDQVVHLNGEKALAYARDRSSGGNADFGRTQRQRNVIMAIVNKARAGGLGDLAKTADNVLPYITHDIDQWRMLGLLTDLAKIKDFEFVQQRIPFDGMYYSQNEMLVPDYKETILKMKETMY